MPFLLVSAERPRVDGGRRAPATAIAQREEHSAQLGQEERLRRPRDSVGIREAKAVEQCRHVLVK